MRASVDGSRTHLSAIASLPFWSVNDARRTKLGPAEAARAMETATKAENFISGSFIEAVGDLRLKGVVVAWTLGH